MAIIHGGRGHALAENVAPRPGQPLNTMWDLSYRWQRQVRFAAGVVVLLVAVIGVLFVARTSPAQRAAVGAHDVLSELLAPAQQTVAVSVPADLLPRSGTPVYLDRADGVTQVVGRVVALEPSQNDLVELKIRFMTPSWG
ncbi:MAG TPA: hypothetical protein VHV08_16045, partial [Pirellulales bacterium]|nr:hypothetical protein [Pirellulales bacterium]